MFRGGLFVFLGACSYGVLSTFVKLAYDDGFSLGEVVGAQVFFGVIILWGIWSFLPQKRAVFANPRVSITLILSGITTAMVSICYYKCVQLLPASIAILLLMQFTWIGILLDWLICGKRPSLLQLVAVTLILGGTALAGGLLSSTSQVFSWVGVFYGIVSAVCFSLFILVSGRVRNSLHPIAKSALLMTGSCITIFLIFPPMFLVNGSLGGGLAQWALWLSVFGVVIPPVFFAKGMPTVGIGLGSIISSAELPVAVIMSVVVLHEQLVILQWLGIAVILLAIALPSMVFFMVKRAEH
ncbi:EamA family transporter [Williamwhitmania taraxaci]|nr:DMT family transporter [Williamwhitmania taraxaci]